MPPPSSNLDKFSRDYDELLELQKAQLSTLQKLLTKEAFQNLADFCEITNAPAINTHRHSPTYLAGGLHTVPVGCELFNFLMESAVPEQVIPEAKPKQHGKDHRSHRTHR
jgi:hypothetical protein